MRPTALVITTVHWPDDTRIRERLIRTLSAEFSVVYASREPGPSDRSGLEYVELVGGRLRRNLSALMLALRSPWDVMILHDPETLLTGLISRLLKRKPVVFDVHEDYPAVAHTRRWVPLWLRPTLSGVTHWALWLAERTLTITLAESSYRRLFTDDHPVFPNYPDTSAYPSVRSDRREEAIYLGDATLARGVDLAIEACSLVGIPLRLIGRVSTDVRRQRPASEVDLILEGVVPNPTALRLLSRGAVGLVPLHDLPNYRYSQPTKILEYLAMGLPVVASDLPGTRELVDGLDAVILVEPGDMEALASGIKNALAPSMRQAAISQVSVIRERFSWPADELIDFYRSILSEPSG